MGIQKYVLQTKKVGITHYFYAQKIFLTFILNNVTLFATF